MVNEMNSQWRVTESQKSQQGIGRILGGNVSLSQGGELIMPIAGRIVLVSFGNYRTNLSARHYDKAAIYQPSSIILLSLIFDFF